MKFSTLLDGINYRIVCPICSGRMDFNCTSVQNTDYLGHHKRMLTWDVSGSETITIDLYTQKFTMTTKNVNGTTYGDLNRYTPSYHGMHSHANFNGIMYLGLGIDCQECCQYGYHLQLIFDISTPTNYTLGVELNSESFSLEESGGQVLHEIRNVYSCHKTEYTRFDKRDGARPHPFWGGKHLVLPLIPLNLSNPAETFQRIKTLVIFS